MKCHNQSSLFKIYFPFVIQLNQIVQCHCKIGFCHLNNTDESYTPSKKKKGRRTRTKRKMRYMRNRKWTTEDEEKIAATKKTNDDCHGTRGKNDEIVERCNIRNV